MFGYHEQVHLRERGRCAPQPFDATHLASYSSDNASDFTLVSTTGGVVDGVTSTVGSPAPQGSGSAVQANATLRSALLNPAVSSATSPNQSYTPGSPGALTIRRTVTNSGPSTVTVARLRVTALSQVNGAPQPGVVTQPATHANLRAVNPTSAASTADALLNVQDPTLDAPATSAGGLGSTLTVSLPSGLAPGASVNIAVTFAVYQGGLFWFSYDMDAK